MELPRFTEHQEHDKLLPLEHPVPPEAFVRDWLSGLRAGRDPGSIRVLDLGCGRGGTVAWLLEQGWDAYGMDVDARYLANGRHYLDAHGHPDRLQELGGDRYPYADASFDVVLSDQVLEHVRDLPALAVEVARVTRPGGLGLHVFPARWRVTESHLGIPFAHWLPKGPARRAALGLALRAGLAAPYFADHPLPDRVDIYATYSEDETFYRSPEVLTGTFEGAGLAVDLSRLSRRRVQHALRGRLPGPLVPAAGLAYRTSMSVYLGTTRRRLPEPPG